MRHRVSLFLVVLLLLVMGACQVQPRYGVEQKKRTPDYDYGHKESPKYKKYGLTTFDLLKLGRIIETYLGRPYKGRSGSDGGLDCSQLVVEVFRKYDGTKLPRTAHEQYKEGSPVSIRQLRFGDLVFYRTSGSRISHVGIFIENNEFVHASLSSGVIISDMNDSYWEKRFAGCRRVLNR